MRFADSDIEHVRAVVIRLNVRGRPGRSRRRQRVFQAGRLNQRRARPLGGATQPFAALKVYVDQNSHLTPNVKRKICYAVRGLARLGILDRDFQADTNGLCLK